jgi:hypothetical protein
MPPRLRAPSDTIQRGQDPVCFEYVQNEKKMGTSKEDPEWNHIAKCRKTRLTGPASRSSPARLLQPSLSLL